MRMEDSRPEDVVQDMEVMGESCHIHEEICEQSTLPSLNFLPTEKVVIPVEVCLKPTSTARYEVLLSAIESMLERRLLYYRDGPILFSEEDEPYLNQHVQDISICDSGKEADSEEVLLFWQVSLKVFMYQLNDEGPRCLEQLNEEDPREEIQGNDAIASFQGWQLPAKEMHGLWESLILEKGLKQRLLGYATSTLLFADKGVNPHLVSWNRVILLHGPPGSGKTSLCKALAQKLSIRFSYRYALTQLVEVDAHSLFSRWFSESGKMVIKLFQKIHELAEEGQTLIFVLIDEVETLAAARQAALSTSEPSDSIRVVNALLTQLDRLKSISNVVVLTTSNLTAAIDIAFVDRADIRIFIGPPSLSARYAILHTCVNELIRAGVISMAGTEGNLLTYGALQSQIIGGRVLDEVHNARSFALSDLLLTTANACQGLSGRALRKLPFLAHAQVDCSRTCSVAHFLDALNKTVLQEIKERSLL